MLSTILMSMFKFLFSILKYVVISGNTLKKETIHIDIQLVEKQEAQSHVGVQWQCNSGGGKQLV